MTLEENINKILLIFIFCMASLLFYVVIDDSIKHYIKFFTHLCSFSLCPTNHTKECK